MEQLYYLLMGYLHQKYCNSCLVMLFMVNLS